MVAPTQLSGVRFGAFEVDLRTGELQKHGHAIRLPDQAFQVLVMLLKHPGELVTREDLQQKLWSANTFVDFDVGLNSAIKKLRDALDDSAEDPRYIQTLPRRGYRFIATVDNGGSASAVGTADAASATPGALTGSSKVRYAAAALVAAALLVLAWLSRDSLRPATEGSATTPPIRSLAVLPLQNLTGDPSQEYFVEGMTDALITDLAQISALRVISRTSAMRYKGSTLSAPEIGRELSVDAVVAGSVVRSGDRVRINAQLVHAPSDRHLWAQSYERNLGDVVALQGDVAQAIAGQIATRLTTEERARLATRKPVNPAAYEAYVRGRYYWNQRLPESHQKSIAYYEQALQADPNYALAYAGLSASYTGQGFGYMSTVPRTEALAKGREAALKAVGLDDSLAEAHAALASVKSHDLDYPGAEAEYQRALQLNPGAASVYHGYATHLLRKGDRTGHCSNMRKSHELDPLNPNVARRVSYCLYWEGKQDEAIGLVKRALELYPDQVNTRSTLGELLAMRGDLQGAIAEYKRAAELSGNHPNLRLNLAWAYLAAGKKEAAFKIRREVEGRPDAKQYAYGLGVVNAGAGRKEEALRWLDLAAQQRAGAIIHVDFRLDPLRSDPRFQEILRRYTHPVPARQ